MNNTVQKCYVAKMQLYELSNPKPADLMLEIAVWKCSLSNYMAETLTARRDTK